MPNTLALVNYESTNTQGANYNAILETPSVSDDGKYVAFASEATNIVSGDTNNQTDIFCAQYEHKFYSKSKCK